MADMPLTSQPQLMVLDESYFLVATKILTAAFRNDPMLAHMFPADLGDRGIAAFFEFLLVKGRLLNESLYGLFCEGELVGVACMEVPQSKRASAFQVAFFILQSLRLVFEISLRNFIFINEYMRCAFDARPKNPHCYLVFIGVHPSHQKKGFGKLMLNYFHEIADKNHASQGVGLDTEFPDNVSLYERFGYKLVATRSVGPITIYSMFRLRYM